MNITLPVEAWNPPIRSTMMSEIDLCPMKFMLSSRYGLRRGYYSEALHMGHLVHILLASIYEGKTLDAGQEECLQFIESEVLALQEVYQSHRDPDSLLPSGKTLGQTTDKMRRDLEISLAATYWFNKSFPALGPGMKCLGTEVEIEVKLYDIVQPVTVQIDAIVQLGNSLWTVDHKTVGSSRKVTDRLKKLPFSLQPALYAKAFKTYLREEYDEQKTLPLREFSPEDYVGHIHNAIRKPSIRQKMHEASSEYMERVGEWYEKSEQEKGEPAFARSWIKFDSALRSDPMHEWWDPDWLRKKMNNADFLSNIEDPINHLEFFPRNDNACDLPGMICPYLNHFCSMGVDQWPLAVKTRFHQNFNPRPKTKQTV